MGDLEAEDAANNGGVLRVLGAIPRALSSRRATLWAMLVMTALLAIANIGLPQSSSLTEAQLRVLEDERPLWFIVGDGLGLMDMYRSKLFLITLGLLLYNLVANLVERVRGVPASMRVTALADARSVGRLPLHTRLDWPSAALDRAVAQTRRAGFRVQVGEDGRSFAGLRSGHAVLGSLCFHASFIVLCVGAALSASQRFSGSIALAVTESFDGSAEQYFAIVPWNLDPAELPELSFELASLEVDFEEGDAIVDARATIIAGDGREHLIRVNEPYRTGNISMRLVDYGMAPVFDILGPFPAHRRVIAAKLNVMPAGRPDQLYLEDTGTTFDVRVYPDYVDDDGDPSSRSRNPLNPVAEVSYERYDRRLTALMPKGERVRLGSYSIALQDVAYWGVFVVDSNPGRIWVYVSFVLGMLGLVWRLAWPRGWVYGVLEHPEDGPTVLHLGGRYEYTQAWFARRFERLTRALTSSGEASADAPRTP